MYIVVRILIRYGVSITTLTACRSGAVRGKSCFIVPSRYESLYHTVLVREALRKRPRSVNACSTWTFIFFPIIHNKYRTGEWQTRGSFVRLPFVRLDGNIPVTYNPPNGNQTLDGRRGIRGRGPPAAIPQSRSIGDCRTRTCAIVIRYDRPSRQHVDIAWRRNQSAMALLECAHLHLRTRRFWNAAPTTRPPLVFCSSAIRYERGIHTYNNTRNTSCVQYASCTYVWISYLIRAHSYTRTVIREYVYRYVCLVGQKRAAMSSSWLHRTRPAPVFFRRFVRVRSRTVFCFFFCWFVWILVLNNLLTVSIHGARRVNQETWATALTRRPITMERSRRMFSLKSTILDGPSAFSREYSRGQICQKKKNPVKYAF